MNVLAVSAAYIPSTCCIRIFDQPSKSIDRAGKAQGSDASFGLGHLMLTKGCQVM